MTPLGETPSITYPGYLGGVDWGSATVDPVRGLLIVNSNRVGNYNQLVPRAKATAMGVKPSLRGSPRALDGIVAQGGTPYAARIKPFLSPLGAPCNAPPYGLISAVDLRTHKLIWSRPLGTARDSGPFGIPSNLPFTLGTPNAGGAITTRSGLIFVAATQERTFRAIDTRTGRELWSARLPAGGQASPMSYQSRVSGRQFVVLATGGNLGLQSKLGDSIIAYALPKTR
jgi:quinoprotein glucose dehydrogenase